MVNFIRESDIVKKPQRSPFKLNPIAAAIAIAMTSQFSMNPAFAGSGFGSGIDLSNAPVSVPTYYANSPIGPVPALTAGATTLNAVTKLPVMVDTGKALRKFVDTLPGFGATKANNLGQYIPIAVPEKWVDLNGVATADDYYEIAAVEYTEKMHSDLPKATHLRGYVQLSTAKNPGKHIALKYPSGLPILDANNAQVYAYDNPHHLGPVIQSTKGTAVRVKFTNYLPVGGELFIPVDTSIVGAGVGPDGVTKYTQNRAEIHLVGGQSPWISAGTPHQWVAPAGETAAYAAGMGKGVSAQNVPDMADPGAGSTTLFFPNDMSARFMFMQDRTSGLTRLNSYAGLEAEYVVTDSTEQGLIGAGTLPAAADTIPLIIEDKTFVPANVAQQDAMWDTTHWGQAGDLWFPHVYEKNQDPTSINGANPVGRWDFGPLFWPLSPSFMPLPTGVYGDASFVPEAYMDTPLVNGTAYPTLTVDPKAYRFRLLNASNDRYINLGWYVADASAIAPQLDRNGNPIVNAAGVQQFFTNTEVKMVPAVADAAGNPVGWDAVNGVQLPLPQYPGLKTNINAEPSGPSRAWPVDARAGGAPDPTTSGPDFIAIGTDGGFLPTPVDIPSQPVTYEANRRSITIGNIYGYGMLLGPAERADTIVDFSKYAGKTLILYNDAPAPAPFIDTRDDYYTGDPDQTAIGGTYATQPGYGPNTRTMMQVKVNATLPGGAAPVAYDPTPLVAAMTTAYGASQDKPIVPGIAYNAAFGTNDPDFYALVSSGSLAQPNLNFTTTPGGGGLISLSGLKLVSSGGVGTGSGSGYDPLNPPDVVFNNVVNGVSCLQAGGTSASATATVDPITLQVSSITNFNGGGPYTCAPTVTFVTKSPIAGTIGVTNGGSGYTAPSVSFNTNGGPGSGAAASVTMASAISLTVAGGSGYTAPTVIVSGGGVTGVTGTAIVGSGAASIAITAGAGYVAPQVTVSGGGVAAGSVTATATLDASGGIATITLTPNAGFTSAPSITIAETDPNALLVGPNTSASATASVASPLGTITGITLSQTTGFTSLPSIVINDATGVGASATAAIVPGTGVITGITVTSTGSGYTSAPSVVINDTGTPTTVATATAAMATSITGVGAQAAVLSSNSFSIPVQTKAEQELFDAWGRYNSTGGVELPLTNGLVQTTVPLSYIDSPTEIIGDSETQIWKLVDNGFWSNSIHFDMVEVQLINRVGWDGTIKAPATNEVGWKDTLRLNPLEDVIVAMRPKHPAIPFGMPRSKRSQDPSLALGAAGTPVVSGNVVGNLNGARFTTDPGVLSPAGVPLLTTTVNTATITGSATLDYDNEFAWGSAILGHSEDDFIRPVVYNMAVTVPDAPSNLTDPLGNGTLTWTDPTPAATSLANVKNEVGFKILQATTDPVTGVVTFAPFLVNGVQATVPANKTSWTQPLPVVPNMTYAVVAYNAAGDSAPSTPFADTIPVAPTTFTGIATAYNSVTLNWAGNSTTNVLQVWRDAGAGSVLIATLPGTATSYVDNTVTAIMTYNYVITATNALGSASAGPVAVTTPMIPVAAPTLISATANATGTSVALRWTDNANNETAYWVDTTTSAGTTRTTITRTAAQGTSTGTALTANIVTVPGSLYTFTITAVDVQGTATSTSAPVTATIDLSPVAPTAAPSGLAAALTSATNVRLTWLDNASNENSYLVTITNTTAVPNVMTTATVTRTAALSLATGGTVTYNAPVVAGNSYSFSVVAQTTRYGQTVASAAAGPVTMDVTAPLAPTTVAAAAGAVAGQVVVTWVDASSNESGFTVQRSLLNTAGTLWGAWGNAGTVAANVTTFTDTGRITGRQYRYQVRANGVVGNSVFVGPSNAVVAP